MIFAPSGVAVVKKIVSKSARPIKAIRSSGKLALVLVNLRVLTAQDVFY